MGARLGSRGTGPAKDAISGALTDVATDAVKKVASIPGKVVGAVKDAAKSSTEADASVQSESVKPARQKTMTEAYAEVLKKQQQN